MVYAWLAYAGMSLRFKSWWLSEPVGDSFGNPDQIEVVQIKFLKYHHPITFYHLNSFQFF